MGAARENGIAWLLTLWLVASLVPDTTAFTAVSPLKTRSAAVVHHISPNQWRTVRTTRRDTTRLFTVRQRRLTTGMAVLTGWADVCMFQTFGCFCSMLTGNMLWMAKAVMEGEFRRVGYYASIMMSYNLGVGLFRRLDIQYRKRTLRICSLLILGLFGLADQITSKWISVWSLAVGFGLINSIGGEVAGTLTFVVTGHFTKLTHIGVDTAWKMPNGLAFDRSAVQNMLVIAGFFGGALFGSFMMKQDRRWMFTTLGVLFASLFYWLDMEKVDGAFWKRPNQVMCELDDDGELCVDDNKEPNSPQEPTISSTTSP